MGGEQGFRALVAFQGNQPVEESPGDPHGVAAARAEAALLREGFSVARNTPYAGGHTTVLHGRPASGRHALQIEINRALYLDENKITRKASFEPVRARLVRAMEQLNVLSAGQLGRPDAPPLAAE